MATILRRRGAALVVVVGVLAILAILAVSFGRLTLLDRTAAATHQSTVRARLAAEAGVSHALARLATGSADALDPLRTPELFGQPVTGILDHPSTSALEAQGLTAGDLEVVGNEGPNHWSAYRVQITSASSRINPNHSGANLRSILDNLGLAISPSNPPIRPGEGREIVAYRDALPGGRFTRVDELRGMPGNFITDDDLRRLAPYLTVDSWVDATTICPAAVSLEEAGATPWMGSPLERPPVGASYLGRVVPGTIEIEPRAPVDINSATKPVLVALLTGISGVYEEPDWAVGNFGPRDFDSLKARGLEHLGQLRRNALSEPIDVATASRLADAIVAVRSMDPATPGAPPFAGSFRTWEQFESFVDSLIERPELIWADEIVARVSPLGTNIQFLYREGTQDYRRDNARQVFEWRLRNHSASGTDIPPHPGPVDLVLSADFGVGLEARGRIDSDYSFSLSDVGEFSEPGTQTLFHVWTGPVSMFRLSFPEGVYTLRGSPEAGVFVRGEVEPPDYRSIAGDLSVRTTRLASIELQTLWDRPVSIDPYQAAAIKANFNPNSRLNKFNPDHDHFTPIDKSDLAYHTTEFCFSACGIHEIDSIGFVWVGDGELLATHRIRATVKTRELWRQTTQEDFEAGRITRAGGLCPVQGGWSLTSYPQPQMDGLPERCRIDGSLMLSTVRVPSDPTLLFWAGFENGLNAERSGGSAVAMPGPAGPYAGDLFDPSRPGTLFPDGVYSEHEAVPTYSAIGNLGDTAGTVAFWVKPGWTRPQTRHRLFDATIHGASYPLEYPSDREGTSHQEFFLEIAEDIWHQRFLFETHHLGRTVPYIRFWDSFQPPIPRRWILYTLGYDVRSGGGEDTIALLTNGRELDDFFAHQWRTGYEEPYLPLDAPAAWTAPESFTGRDNVFGLGPKYLDDGFYTVGRNPRTLSEYYWVDQPADSTFDELATYGGFQPRSLGPYLYRLGRYYNHGDARFESAAFSPPRGSTIESVHWTARIPRTVPGGRVRMEIKTGERWSPPVENAGGSPVEIRADGPVQFAAFFEETAEEGVEPLLTSPAVDDVTVVFRHAPVFLRYEEIVRLEQDRPAASGGETDEEEEAMDPPLPSRRGRASGRQIVYDASDYVGFDLGEFVREIASPVGPKDLPEELALFAAGDGEGIRPAGDARKARTRLPDDDARVRVDAIERAGSRPFWCILTVVDGTDTHSPLPDARVVVRGPTGAVLDGRTDEDGRCWFLAHSDDDYVAEVQKEGYQDVQHSFHAPQPAADGGTPEVTIPLARETR